jgi:tetratricopeptide (TPR) repeat protein
LRICCAATATGPALQLVAAAIDVVHGRRSQEAVATAYGVKQPQVSRWAAKLDALLDAAPDEHLSELVLQNALSVLYWDRKNKPTSPKITTKIMPTKEERKEIYKANNTKQRRIKRKNEYTRQLELAGRKAWRGRKKSERGIEASDEPLVQLPHVLSLARKLTAYDKLADAEPLFMRALQGYEQQLGEAYDKLADAEPLFMRARWHKPGDAAARMSLDARMSALRTHERRAGTLNEVRWQLEATLHDLRRLAGAYKIEGKLGKAEELLRRVLEGSENSLPFRVLDVKDETFHSYTLEVVHALADLLFEQGRKSKLARPGKFSEAATLYRRLLEPDEYTQIAGSEAQIGATHAALRIASDLANMKRGPVDARL